MMCCGVDLSEVCSPQTFKALGDANRLSILSFLAATPGGARVGDVASCCPVDLSVVSRHLAVLRDAGVIECVKRGREVFCSVRVPQLVAMLRQLADALEASETVAPAESDGGRAERAPHVSEPSRAEPRSEQP